MSDGEEVIASSHATGTSEGTKSSSAGTEEPSLTLKNRRKQLRGKVTRTINRVRKFITDQDQTKRRIEKELEELRKDFELARDVHAELYGYVDPSQVPKLDEWENVLTDDVFGVEEEAETYFKTLGNPSASVQQEVSAPTPSFVQQQTPGLIAQGSESSEPSASHEAGENLQDSVSGQQDIVSGIVQQQAPSTAQGSSNLEEHGLPPPVDGHVELEETSSSEIDNNLPKNESPINTAFSEDSSLAQSKGESGSESISSSRQPNVTRSGVIQSPKSACPVDAWISDLVEFEETRLSSAVREMSIADALYKLEASKDIPAIKLVPFNGSPLQYVEFVEQFRIHIHDKPHLKDDTRMVQLRRHVTGDAERTISGLGSQGIMYATALKTLKENFGQPSVIARAFIRKITERRKFSPMTDRPFVSFPLI